MADEIMADEIMADEIMAENDKANDGAPDRRTWELELLISGAILFTLLQLPSKLVSAVERLQVNADLGTFVTLFMGYTYLQFAVYVLIGTLIVHLAARAYWVGLIGLRSVFPLGVRWRQLTLYGPRTEAFYRAAQPSLATAIRATNAFCSSLFSIAFALSSIFLMSIFLVVPLAAFAFYIDRVFSDGELFMVVFYTFLTMLVLPPLVLTLIDKKVAHKGKNDRLAAVIRIVLRPYYWLYFVPLVNPIMMTFRSHSRRVVFFVIYGLIFVALMATVLGGILATTDALSYDSLVYFPAQPGERAIDSAFYEDQHQPGAVHAVPSISSDIVTGPYVRLFLPYRPRRFNEQMAIRCPDLEPLRAAGLRFHRGSRFQPASDEIHNTTAKAAACLASLHEITLDGQRLEEGDPSFYRQPNSGVGGLLFHLPTVDLAPGKHILKIRTQTELPEEDEDKTEADDDDLREYVIPFWR